MAKKAPFFSHDMNARNDPKISAMRAVYGAQGYGWWWMLIEIMAESDGYKLDYKSKYIFNAYAMQLQCKPEEVQEFIMDCINEFELFESDGTYFWSKSLLKRMQYRDAVSEKRSEAAAKRWGKERSNANASIQDAIEMQSDAKVMQTDANKTKQNYKQNETINISTTTGENPFRLFESEGFGTLSASIGERLGEMIDQYGERWVCEAMKEASFYGKRSLPYVISILQRYRTSGVDEPWKIEKPAYVGKGPIRQRPQLPIVTSTDQAPELSEDKLREMCRLAHRVDGKGEPTEEEFQQFKAKMKIRPA
ncbi:hypothetical protein PACILC2_07060 [Paenibacillus cisolokensis]|uniref:Lin1244/Lin1753-like N-terminal domain-containing protein n=1 Tax=Paenibacillus cisolokensis TaxID=1658519 RepID=A0ABQ4N1U2_9BACL|nr:Lin1244/Lin1753 domain-containing protein [Paenibacillus cisolokensis]GIQ62138.1 hypothetical protein PACILC2_07060 [Paenibacillus cisolokensis]